MKEFMLIFHQEINDDFTNFQEQVQASKWEYWIRGIEVVGKLQSKNLLANYGRVISPGNIIKEKSYTEVKETMLGNIVVKAKDIIAIETLAKDCPLLELGVTVEIRPILEIN